MSRWTGESVARVLGTQSPGEVSFRAITTDTRTLRPGDLFVALRGERFDGHDYLDAARTAGAAGAVVLRGTPPVPGLFLFEVDGTLAALGALARFRRRDISGPVVAITGTNGKTSTRALVAEALKTRWTIHATTGNLNNEIGVPLTILSAPEGVEALVLEAGASERGELARLRTIIAPTMGVVTNVAAGHVEGFGSLEGVLEEKVSLLEGVPTAVVGLNPPALAERAREVAGRVVTAGLESTADVRPDSWSLDPSGRGEIVFRGHTIRLSLVGKHQVENATIALALADLLSLDLGAVAEALSRAQVPGGRCEMIASGDRVIIHDAYNSNPASLTAALAAARAIRGDRPLVVVVGSMLELGAISRSEHERMAREVMAEHPALIGAVGEFVPAFESLDREMAGRLVTSDDAETLGDLLAARIPHNALILLKASRGIRLERALPQLLATREDTCSTTS